MRYRQDVPSGANVHEVAQHVATHLAGAVDPDDDPSNRIGDVRITVRPHEDFHKDLVAVIGEIDGEPSAPYLGEDYDPAADHHDIGFTPYENPAANQFADPEALRRFREGR